MKMHLTLIHRYQREIVLIDDERTTLAAIDCGEPHPAFPIPDGAVFRVTALDVLEHASDEEAWLAECARVLVPGGELTIQVPHRGMMSWWDALNLYRYAESFLSNESDHGETEPIGWHRQYRERELRALLDATGYSIVAVRTHSLGLAELPHLARMISGEVIGRDLTTGERAKAKRTPIDQLDARIPAGPLSRRIVLRARKVGRQ
jgi:SAM-dependent methyltransferase